MYLEGEAPGAIATRLGKTPRVVSWWIGSPVFQEELERRRAAIVHQANEELRRGAHKAAAYLCAAVQPDHQHYERINGHGIRAACAILDRMGLAAYAARTEEPPEPEEQLESAEEIRRVLSSLPRHVVLELLDGEAA